MMARRESKHERCVADLTPSHCRWELARCFDSCAVGGTCVSEGHSADIVLVIVGAGTPGVYPASIRINVGGSITASSPAIRSSAARIALSRVSCVTRTTGTASPGARPRCSIDSNETP